MFIDKSIKNFTASFSKQLKLTNIFLKNNLTPKDYFIFFIVLRETLTAIIVFEDKKFSKAINCLFNNLKFNQKHIDRILAILNN
ncbi:hypothetical protein BHOIPH791_10900 [Bartonella henselae]|nr:hypothetical protein Q654_01669 [Bartonella henselae JK 50]ETS05097.1 hypothetical protein Q655_01616 [Bartonella henselae JK 51]OLL37898.1 hypothetical protein AT237_02760 [Bartonella henselae]OLL44453.1 hypothetical protein AT242_01200 [Bartonella henselae]OLL59188.1 hypothetical protein AT248_06305 [Bartonella henselae]